MNREVKEVACGPVAEMKADLMAVNMGGYLSWRCDNIGERLPGAIGSTDGITRRRRVLD